MKKLVHYFIGITLVVRYHIFEMYKRVNVDFPLWMIHSLDKEAKRIGVPRQSIIKIWIAERLQAVGN